MKTFITYIVHVMYAEFPGQILMKGPDSFYHLWTIEHKQTYTML